MQMFLRLLGRRSGLGRCSWSHGTRCGLSRCRALLSRLPRTSELVNASSPGCLLSSQYCLGFVGHVASCSFRKMFAHTTNCRAHWAQPFQIAQHNFVQVEWNVVQFETFWIRVGKLPYKNNVQRSKRLQNNWNFTEYEILPSMISFHSKSCYVDYESLAM